jgi:hypothetical protein
MHDEPWQVAWSELTARCERNAALAEQAWRRATTDALHGQLATWRRWRWLEQAVGIATVVMAVSVVLGHAGELRYLAAGATVFAFGLAVVIAAIGLLVRAAAIDLAGDVVASQRGIEVLLLAEFRNARLWLLGGVVVWLPTLLLVVEALTGTPALRHVHFPWFAANLTFGAFLLILGRAWSRRIVEPERRHPWSRQLVDLLTGRPLQEARERLREIAEFAEPTGQR